MLRLFCMPFRMELSHKGDVLTDETRRHRQGLADLFDGELPGRQVAHGPVVVDVVFDGAQAVSCAAGNLTPVSIVRRAIRLRRPAGVVYAPMRRAPVKRALAQPPAMASDAPRVVTGSCMCLRERSAQ